MPPRLDRGDEAELDPSVRAARRRVLLVLAMALVLDLPLVQRAAAEHVAGATYDGTHATGGTIRLSLTADGSGITRIQVTEISGDLCSWDSVTNDYIRPLPITDHAFEDPNGQLTVSGTFPAAQQAEGTFRFTEDFPIPCDSGEVAWSARTSAPPGISDECAAARRSVRKARASLEKSEGARAKDRARARLGRARARQRAACAGA